MVIGCFDGGGQKKESKAFTQPLWIARKSSSNASDEGEDGYSFGNMMCMMMMQNCVCVCVCVSGLRLRMGYTVMHEIPISIPPTLMTSLPYPRTQ